MQTLLLLLSLSSLALALPQGLILPPGLGGDDSGPPCAGCPGEPLDIESEEIKSVLDFFSSELLKNLMGGEVENCEIRLEDQEVRSQVVAGTNYIITTQVHLEGEGCGDQESPLICTEFYIFKPLPFACETDDGCLELSSGPEEVCSAKTELDYAEPVPDDIPLLGGFGEPLDIESDEVKPILELFSSAVVEGLENCTPRLEEQQVRSQVVAGTNYIIDATVHLEGEGCGDQESPLICTEFYVFKPLSVNCDEKDGCLELSSGVQEACRSEAEINRILGEPQVLIAEPVGIPGGFSELLDNESDEVKPVLEFFSSSLAGELMGGEVENCEVRLENPIVTSQVVAGTNYIIDATIHLEGEGCGDQESPLICTEFYVFKPLPFACETDDGCLELSSGVQEVCKSEAEIDRILKEGTPEEAAAVKGGFRVGGHEEVTDLEAEENKRALDFFADRMEVQTFGADLEDCKATLEDVSLKTQLVAGFNYIIDAKVNFEGEGCGCPNCPERSGEPVVCTEAYVYEPLEVYCLEPEKTEENPACLQLTTEIYEICQDPNPGYNGIPTFTLIQKEDDE